MNKKLPDNLIEYITKNTDLRQADLAKKLRVSRAQISKWKSGECMPHDREEQLMKIAGLFDTVCTDWAIFALTEENATAWYDYMLNILNDSEWAGTLAELYSDTPDIYTVHVIRTLHELGVKLPHKAPVKRWADEDNFESTPLAGLLYELFDNWAQYFSWINPTFWFDDEDKASGLFDLTQELEWSAFDLSLAEVDPEQLIALGVDPNKLQEFNSATREEVKNRIHSICQIRTKHGLPITADYFQLLYLAPIELAEQAWFGTNERDAIKEYLPYGQQLILSHLECTAYSLGEVHKKLNKLLADEEQSGE